MFGFCELFPFLILVRFIAFPWLTFSSSSSQVPLEAISR